MDENKTQLTQNQTILIDEEEVEKLKQCLPKANFMGSSNFQLVQFQGFWCPASLNLKNVLIFQRHFCARDTDLIIASLPKTGTTWLMSLLFAIINRAKYPINESPLLTHHPHELVHRPENGIHFDVNELPSPRLLHTHLPYSSLPESIKISECAILYISRNPLDAFVSQWNFYPNIIKKHIGEDFELPSVEEFFKDCYEGRVPYGPFFEHVLGYWKQSLERSDKVLFLKYEDLKDNPILHLKKLAKFVGFPFSFQEESEGVIEKIVELCSIDNMKELEGNKHGALNKLVEKNAFFRKGEVGDWANFFYPNYG